MELFTKKHILAIGSFLIFIGCQSSMHTESTILFSTNPPSENHRPEENAKGKILYYMTSGASSRGVQAYLEYIKELGNHDFDLLQQMAIALIDQGSRSKDPEDILRAIFGAGISGNPELLHILEKGLNSRYPQIQLAALNFISLFHDTRSDTLLQNGMHSPYLLINLESAHHLAQKQQNIEQIEGLMHKVNDDIKPLFARIFALIDTPAAFRNLKMMLASSDINMRIEAIFSIIENKRDSLLPDIYKLAKQVSPAQQEACAVAFGIFKDESTVPILERYSSSSSSYVRLAAWQALYKLGRKRYYHNIEQAALGGNLYAIALLQDIPEAIESLRELSESKNIQESINATAALLRHEDPYCIRGVEEILLRDYKDYSYEIKHSPGKALTIWKAIPSTKENSYISPYTLEVSLKLKEETLQRTQNLPNNVFLALAKTIFNSRQTALVPTLVDLLENLATQDAIALLKHQSQMVGAPLTRAYCNLALYRLNEKGPYHNNMERWLREYEDSALIHFRTILPWRLNTQHSTYQLTPEEKSRLLIDTFSAIANSRDERSVEILLSALKRSSPKNQYALAGLLLHVTQ